ncbi:MAG TPA: DUF2567 domain-containing protein [Actinophytocola sp.]|uniref:DUF2567 domain-containing protein n=1 Tax=Actinophytocola sp. TaxID=1872138 RepID=UPI002DB950FC|nr:DUF2567 domain-containing protein [Actinophytocola sp.]HEU5474516.1 DUF2567 domain-containing protein [Actinophytocola sp.]
MSTPADHPPPESGWVVGLPTPLPWRPPPRVIIRADLVPAVIVFVAVGLLGIGIGWIWSLIAPPQRMRVLADRQVPLPVESYHKFDDLALFVLLSLGAGLVTGTALWLLRGRRGPVVMVAAVLGSFGAAALAMALGLAWAQARYALPEAPTVGDVVAQAPVLETAWCVLAWPLATALGYGILSAWNGADDLDR